MHKVSNGVSTVGTSSLRTRLREREKLMELSFFSRRSEKSNFRRIATIFFSLANMGSIKLIFFQIFQIKGRVGLKWIEFAIIIIAFHHR